MDDHAIINLQLAVKQSFLVVSGQQVGVPQMASYRVRVASDDGALSKQYDPTLNVLLLSDNACFNEGRAFGAT